MIATGIKMFNVRDFGAAGDGKTLDTGGGDSGGDRCMRRGARAAQCWCLQEIL